MRTIKMDRKRWKVEVRQLTLPRLAGAALASLAVAFSISGCVNVTNYAQPALVRVIDASYLAPSINVLVQGTGIAGNVGQGIITPYATLNATTSASIKITNAGTGGSLTTTSNPLLAGHQYSVFLSDAVNTPSGYTISVLNDQQISAATGHSAYRFLNQAIKTGAVDIYMIPFGNTLDNTIPLVSNLPVGASLNYIEFPSQAVTMIVTPTGKLTPSYGSTTLFLSGGEVRTVLLVDAQLTSNPPVEAFTANDVN
jgi:hypothetical protein